MIAPMQDNDELMLQAYCDDELDAASRMAFERRLASDADLRRRADSIMALRKTLRAIDGDSVPPDLQARIRDTIDEYSSRQDSSRHDSSRQGSSGQESSARNPRNARRGWPALAACLCAGVLAGAVLMSLAGNNRAHEDVANALVAGHIRGLLAPQPFDIASSDRHTVKPWFTTRLPVSPQVADLTAAGFTLAGGRIDVIGQQPVATLVYRHAAHLVSLTMLPGDQAVPAASVSGYRAVSWRDGNATFVAVSDLPEGDIEKFAQAFRAQAGRP